MKRKKIISSFLISALFFAATASASHFRGGTMTASIDSDGSGVLTAVSFWRPNELDLLSPTLNNGTVALTQTSMITDTSDARFTKRTQTFGFNTTATGNLNFFTNFFTTSCCRVKGMKNATESFWNLETTLVRNGTNAAATPTFNFSSIQPEVIRGTAYSQNLNAIGTGLTYDLALNQSITSLTPGLTISPTGTLQISAENTTTLGYNLTSSAGLSNAGADYAFSGHIKDSAGSSVEFDWVFDAVNSSQNLAPTVNDYSYTGYVGDSINQTITASDPENGSLTNLTYLGMLGAVPNIAPVWDSLTKTFSWNTLGSLAGTYISQFRTADSNGLTDIGSFTINLSAPQSVPEPSTLFLLGISLIGLGLFRKRFKVIACIKF